MEFYHHKKLVQVEVYPDDTLEMAYYKLSVALKCSIDDIYLFSSRHYDILTASEQFKRLELSGYDGIPAFHLQNFYEGINQPLTIKGDFYQERDLDDLYNVEVEFPIGQDVKSAANPNNADDLELYKVEETEVSTLKQKLLLDYMPFHQIHVCLKKDYGTKYANYFNHDPLDADVMKLQNAPLVKLFEMSKDYVPKAEGINHIVCRLEPLRPMSIPLDTLFNYLHVTDELPMIQYNTGTEETLMYKLLTKQVDLKGDKIPVLDETTVRKHDKSYKKSVTVFTTKKKNLEIIYGFLGDGSIKLEMNCQAFTVDQIDEAFLVHKKLLDRIGEFMFTSGFVYPTFRTIRNAVIEEMDLFALYDAKGKRTCANPFFVGSGDEIRYRRVSGFNENDLINELCIEYYDRGEPEKLVPLIKQILGISEEKSRVIAKEHLSEMESLRSTQPNKRFVVKNRIGFVSNVLNNNEEIRMTISGINSIYYLESIQRNMKAYVAFQESPSVSCQEHVQPVIVNPFVYQYDSDSDSDSDSDDEGFEPQDEPEEEGFEPQDEGFEPQDEGFEPQDEGFEPQDEGFEPQDEGFEPQDEGFEQEPLSGGVYKDLDRIVRNESFLITRIKLAFNPSKDYAKQCPLNRRPVVLKEGEKDKVPENDHRRTHNGHTFVCTKYWDMKNKIPLDEIGEGKLIDENIVKGREVDFEKDGTIVRVQPEKYKFNPYPGIMRKDDMDVPCCFIKKQESPRKEKKIAESKQYIVHGPGLNEPGQVGRLPKSIRYFFGWTEKNTELLRYGIEKPHSFIQCIDAVFKKTQKSTLVKQMDLWIRSGFNTYNNGNLKVQFKTIDAFSKHLPNMDYTYLWEMVSDVFNANLVIFRETREGDYLEVICPSNHYSTRSFDPSKKSLMILEHKVEKGYAFEPLVYHNVKENTQIFLHEFKNKHLHEGMKALVQIYSKCKTTTSSYTLNMTASVMYNKLHRPTQIIHENKCIGFLVEDVFVPCYPSAILSNVPKQERIPVIAYKPTVSKLDALSKDLPCKPQYKVVEQGNIVGIILETLAFVPCTPIPNYPTDLPLYTKVQYEYDLLPNEIDQERIRKTQHVKAEKCLYAACRRLLKEILGKDAELRRNINKLIQRKQVAEEDIRDILRPRIQFVNKTDESFIATQVKCGGCCFASDKLILPKHNLLTKQPNDYFSRLAEELNYYTRFSTFIMSPQLLIPEVPFSVHENELLLTYSMIHSYYASLMEAKRLPEYYSTLDNANPKHTPYTMKILKVQKMNMITL